jgi:hypothetical protein
MSLKRSQYDKVKKAIAESLCRTEFVLVFVLDRKEVADLTDADVPPNCMLIAKEELDAVYGKLFSHRL